MQRLLGTAIPTIATITALCACSGGGGTGGGGGSVSTPTPPPVVTESYTFPANGTATTGTAWSIVGVKTTLSGKYGNVNGIYDTLRVDVTFAQNVANALPAPGQMPTLGAQLGVRISLDTDGNMNTGTNGSCNPSISGLVTPFEYSSDPGRDPSRLADGNYAILGNGGAPTYEGGSNPAAEAVTSVSGAVFSQSFYLPTISVFDGAEIPKIGIEVSAFNGLQNTDTDCVPQGNLVEVFTDQNSSD